MQKKENTRIRIKEDCKDKIELTDIIKIYSKSFERKLDVDIAMQCAPLIFRKKISNILITENYNRKEAEAVLHNAGFSTYLLYQGKKKIMMLVYNKDIFWDYIEKKECREFLETYGYNLKGTTGNNRAVEIFGKIVPKLSEYMKTKQKFPHELGILLGYPQKDVQGFIENHGKNFLYSGYWKVYSDLQTALFTFQNYNRAKNILIRLLLKGFTIREILELSPCFILDNRKFAERAFYWL